MKPYLLSEEESDRLNILRVLSIIFVVYIHSYSSEVLLSPGNLGMAVPAWLLAVENGLSQTVARCAVPMFFLISSLLLFRRPRAYIQTLGRKVRTLLVPYLIFNTFWIGVILVLQQMPFTSSYFLRQYTPLLQASFSQWLGMYGLGTEYPLCYPLWFMRDLMVVTLLFPAVARAARRFPRVLLALAVALLLIPVDFPFKTALLWFVIGACLVELDLHVNALDSVSLWKLSLFYAGGALAALLTDMDSLKTLFNLLGVLYWARVSKSIYRHSGLRKGVLKLSQWIFMIYGLHELTVGFAKAICLKLFPVEPVWILAEYLLLPLAVIAFCVTAGMVFKKAAPRLYALCTGAR